MVDPQFPHLHRPGSSRPGESSAAVARQSASTPVSRMGGDIIGRSGRTRIAIVTAAAVLATGLAMSPASAHDPQSEDDSVGEATTEAAQDRPSNSVVGQTAETGVDGQPAVADDGVPADDSDQADPDTADGEAPADGEYDGTESDGSDEADADTADPGPTDEADDTADGEGGSEEGDPADEATDPAENGDDDEDPTEPSDENGTDPATDDEAPADETADDDEATDDQDDDETTDDGEEAEDEEADEEETVEEDPEPVETVTDEEGNPIITFPVVGPVNFVDTWGACRGVGCHRGHKGVDIFAHKLAPLVAAADGVISGDRRSAMGISGNTLVLTTDDGWRYLYIHLNNDSPGTDDGSNPQAWIVPNRARVGDRVKAGDVIGYVGDSGNAERTPSHVHFEVHRPGEGAINPTPAVRSAQEAGRVIPVSALASTPEGRAEHEPTILAWYRALLDRDPTPEELFAWADRFDIDFATADDLIADLTMAKPRRDAAGTIVRAFEVALKRRPSLNEIRQWEEAYRNGADLDVITKTLIESDPFRDKHGELSDEEFVRVIYRNAIGVDPSPDRLEDWLTLFAEGSPRETLTTYWADSYSVKNSTWHDLEVVQSFRAALDRMPTDEEHAQWVGHLDAGGLIPDVVDAIRTG